MDESRFVLEKVVDGRWLCIARCSTRLTALYAMCRDNDSYGKACRVVDASLGEHGEVIGQAGHRNLPTVKASRDFMGNPLI